MRRLIAIVAACAITASGCGSGSADPLASASSAAEASVSGLACSLAAADVAHAQVVYLKAKGNWAATVQRAIDEGTPELKDKGCSASDRAELKSDLPLLQDELDGG
jgi:hypothetical protein